MSFHFLTGNLIKAMKRGEWVLIDEINLANNELLQKLLPAIEGKPLLFYERGDQTPIKVHPDFRLIGCMNPGSDIGKKELPSNIKSKFTIYKLEEMTKVNDLVYFVRGINKQINAEVLTNFYLNLKQQNHTHYSLRNLSRAL
jgi:midasin